MPFPLAHPAAVLPLRRYSPRFLSFPALVIGSLSPDVGYCFGGLNVDVFSHRFLGSIGFCLPVGILMLGVFYGLRSRVVGSLPDRYQRVFLPLCRRPLGSPLVVIISLLVGTWTHILWDSFTHNDGWFVEHLALLQTPVISLMGRTVRLCHLLWYVCSFAGVAWLCLAFEKWKQPGDAGVPGAFDWAMTRDAVLVAFLVLPIELVHHLIHGMLGIYLMAVLCMLLAIGVALRIGKAGRSAPANGQDGGGHVS